MNLDDTKGFSSLDPEGMLKEIDSLPEQLEAAWNLGHKLELPHFSDIQAVIVAGMGGSAIGADLLAASIADECRVPMFVQRDYELPAWAKAKNTLVILSSHSGNTEETLSAYDQALAAGCQMATISTGGKLLEKAQHDHVPTWVFKHNGQPRAAVGFSYGLLLALFERLELVSSAEKDIQASIFAMTEQRKKINAESPIRQNPAKRLAGQMVGRYVTVFAAGHMAPAARRWKTQINEVAKTIAAFEALPEADHNTLAGVCFPNEVLTKAMSLFIRSESDHPRVKLRFDLTQQTMMEEGINTDSYLAVGKSRMEQLWRAIQFGDFVSFYLAMAYEVNPTEIPTIQALKEGMSK